jgi:hypothetical protein
MTSLGFAIQMFTLVGTSDHTFIGTIGGQKVYLQYLLVGLSIPASILLLALTFFGVMKENKFASIFVIFFLAAVEPYFIYQLVYLHLPINQNQFLDSRKYLTFFSKYRFQRMPQCHRKGAFFGAVGIA